MRGFLVAFGLTIALFTPAALAQAPGGFGNGVPDMSVSGDRGDPSKNYQAGVEAIQKNDFPLAESFFKKVLHVAPRDGNTLFFYGYAKAQQNDFEGAEKAYRKAIKYNPDHVQALREHALVSLKLNERDDAAKDLNKLKSLDAKCASTCPDAGQLKETIPFVEQALSAPAVAQPVASQPPATQP
jgi:Flp pilus assembly protein TadD